jgi:hypothetical protein
VANKERKKWMRKTKKAREKSRKYKQNAIKRERGTRIRLDRHDRPHI